MKQTSFIHADFAKLEAAVLSHGGFARFDDHAMYGSVPGQPSFVVDLPTVDIYESVDVAFDAAPDEDLLRTLGFPFKSLNDIV